MKKVDELADPKSCLNRALPETLLFVLLDWDPATAATIRFWAFERVKRGLNRGDDPQIMEAMRLASEIDASIGDVRATRKAGAMQEATRDVVLGPAPTSMRERALPHQDHDDKRETLSAWPFAAARK